VSAALLLLQRLTEAADGLLRGGYLLVQDGEGFETLPETLPLKTGARARVVRVDSELALRHALWKARPAPVVALVPENLDLGADLRLGAERRRVHTISGDEVLSALLSVRVTGVDDQELRALAIEYASQIQARLHNKTTPTVIDRALLERTLVEVVADLQDLRASQVRLSDLLARWIHVPPVWTPVVRRLASTTLAANHGDAGRVLGWALEDPAVRMRALLVHGALLGVEGEVPSSAWGPLAPLKAEPGSPLRAPMMARDIVVSLAADTAAELRHAARPLLDEADRIARTLLPSAQLQTSALLPLAFEERAHAVATRLAAGESPPRDAMRALRTHALASTAQRQLDLLDDMDRLVRYLRQPRVPATGVRLAKEYLADHAFADRCARRIERALASVPAHHAEARALLAQVRAARDALNDAWAKTLAKSYTATLYSNEVVALQNVVRDELVPRLDGKGVFLLVLDGCSVPVFLDLLDQLVDPHRSIGLERGAGMTLRYGTGLSPLPTITSHARGALFLGAVPKDPFALETTWREEGERKSDPARWKQNPALKDVSRLLFLKGDLSDGGAALQAALRGPTQVVAAVFNAVDDRIGSHDTGAAWRLDVDDVTGLLPALHAALDAGRKVLLAPDHGHSPFRGTELRVSAGSSPRYVRLKPGEPVPEGFLEIDCGDLAGEPGRTAFAWRSAVYRGQVQVGFHGGCSLEEMVVPIAWLARDGVAADPPAWWFDAGAPEVATAPPPKPKEQPKPQPTPQPVAAGPAELPFVMPVGPSAPVERLPAALRSALQADEQKAVAWILADGPIRTSLLAKRLGRPTPRVQGLLSKLNRTLAEHGARLEHETLPDHEQQWRYVGPGSTP
jgi:hypothetical protein